MEEISQKIQAIQVSTQAAVGAIGEISKVINQINTISNTIAVAVEEQSATTNEISRNVAEAARGVDEITQNVTGVAGVGRSTSSGASDTQTAAEELAHVAAELQSLVRQFEYSSGEPERSPIIRPGEASPKGPTKPAELHRETTHNPAGVTLRPLESKAVTAPSMIPLPT